MKEEAPAATNCPLCGADLESDEWRFLRCPEHGNMLVNVTLFPEVDA